MNTYKVNIIETNITQAEIKAECVEDLHEIIDEQYSEGQILFDDPNQSELSHVVESINGKEVTGTIQFLNDWEEYRTKAVKILTSYLDTWQCDAWQCDEGVMDENCDCHSCQGYDNVEFLIGKLQKELDGKPCLAPEDKDNIKFHLEQALYGEDTLARYEDE